MAKLVDAVALRPTALMHEGSSPSPGTNDDVTERLGGGLQPLLGRFNSVRRLHAEMVEMVYTLVSDTSAARLVGSSPSLGTNNSAVG